jgi:hypothetical protein
VRNAIGGDGAGTPLRPVLEKSSAGNAGVTCINPRFVPRYLIEMLRRTIKTFIGGRR